MPLPQNRPLLRRRIKDLVDQNLLKRILSLNGLKLVAVEYLVLADDWNANNASPPVLMGQVFNYNGSPNRYGMPAFYELHVWAWKNNPNGVFADWNPGVSCERYNPVASSNQ
jgi:hypothetical protein